jgi:hypothetical protein
MNEKVRTSFHNSAPSRPNQTELFLGALIASAGLFDPYAGYSTSLWNASLLALLPQLIFRTALI